jgi:hypothetical protein
MGKLPDDFNSDRTKADDFIEEVKGYLRLNAEVAGFNSPRKKIAFTLTHMKGPEVAGWVRDMGTLLDNLDPANNVDALWEQFLTEFAAQYQDSQREANARHRLASYKMKFPEIDQYIAGFEELCRRANYTAGNPETLQFFLQGLSPDVLRDVHKPPFAVGYNQTKERAIQVTQAILQIKSFLGGGGGSAGFTPRFNQNNEPRRVFYSGNANNNNQWRQNAPQYNSSTAPRQYNNMPVPMDIGKARFPVNRGQGRWQQRGGGQRGWRKGGQSQTNLALTNQPTSNACFECGQEGHYACNCPRRGKPSVNLLEFDDESTVVEQEPLAGSSRISRLTQELASMP